MDRISFGEYYILCIRRIWVDWPSMGLPIFPSSCVGSDELGLCLGCCEGAWMWHGAHCSFGLVSGILDPFLYPHKLPPSPCVRTAWARAVIIPATVAISTCLLGLISPDRRHMWCVNDNPLGFALVFHTPFAFPYFLPTSSVLSSSGLIPSFIFSALVFSLSPGFSFV